MCVPGSLETIKKISTERHGQLSPWPMLGLMIASSGHPPGLAPPSGGHSLDTVPLCPQGARELTEQGVSQEHRSGRMSGLHDHTSVCCPRLKIKHKVFGGFLWVCIINDGNFPYSLG